MLDQYPRYAVLLADTHLSRIVVVAANTIEATEQVTGVKTRRHKMGGWSQARYQRHIDNYHQQHAKEVADTLARLVRDEAISAIVIAGDEVAVPLVRRRAAEGHRRSRGGCGEARRHAPERQIVEATIEALRQKDADTDREQVDAVLGAYRAVVSPPSASNPRSARFELGQVDALLITAAADTIDPGTAPQPAVAGDRSPEERAADELVAKARQTAATIRFIEDPALLAAVGGVAAFLRFKL